MSNDSITEQSRSIVKTLYEAALKDGDYARAFSVLDPDLVVNEPSYLPYGGVTRGIDAFAKLFAVISGYMDIPGIQVQSLLADGNVVVAFLRGKTLDTGAELLLCERSVVRNGKIVEMTIYYHEAASLLKAARH